jgi:hypothetical protein
VRRGNEAKERKEHHVLFIAAEPNGTIYYPASQLTKFFICLVD